jgi:hypothetical protein
MPQSVDMVTRGADGTNGTNGTNGPNGTNGTNGSNGVDGTIIAVQNTAPAGASAGDLWVDTT